MHGRRLWSLLFAFVLLLGPAAGGAFACPFCGEANASDEHRVQAFQVSILFMLSAPILVFGGFTYGLYRLNRREKQALGESFGDEDSADSSDGSPAYSASDSNPVGSSQ